MTVTDGDRYAIAMAKLSQARSAVYEATRIIEHLFESDGPSTECQVLPVGVPDDSGDHDSDPVTGLYAGQIQPPTDYTDVDPEEPEVETEECLE
jgi:hypothetical protein